MGLSLAGPAMAESVSVSASTSTRVTTVNGETVTQTEERYSESRAGNDTARASAQAGSYRSRSCITVNGQTNCVEDTSGDQTKLDEHTSASVRVNGMDPKQATTARQTLDTDWWDNWRARLTQALQRRNVASDEAEDRISGLFERMQMRIAKRICAKFDTDERERCLEAAEENEGGLMRARLREWVDRL